MPAVLNHLREATIGEEVQVALLFGRLCQIACEGAATATKWTRASLLVRLRGTVQLRGIPNFKDDVVRIDAFSREGVSDVAETVDDFHVPRAACSFSDGRCLQTAVTIQTTVTIADQFSGKRPGLK